MSCDGLLYVLPFFEYVKSNPFGTCSSQGSCEAGGLCVCKPGWTGRSDFIDTDKLDCQINENAIVGLWALLVFVLLVSLFVVRREVVAKWEQHVALRDKKAEQHVKFSVRENRGMMAILWFLFVTTPGLLAMAAIKFALPNERVGFTWPVTILFAVTKVGFYTVAFLFQPALLATILRGQRNMRNLIRLSNTFMFWNMCVSCALGFLPFLTILLADSVANIDKIIYVTYFAGSMISMLSFAVQAAYIRWKVVSVLNKSYEMTKSTGVLEIKARLVQFQTGIIVQGSVQCFVYAAFLFLPFLWNKHDYFLPISWISMPLLYTKLARSTVTTKRVGGTSTVGTHSKSESRSKTENSFSYQNNGGVGSSVNLQTNAMSSFQSMQAHSFVEKAVSMYEDPEAYADGSEDDEYV